MIIKAGQGFTVRSHDGTKVLGHHSSREAAEAQERAISHAQVARENRPPKPPRKTKSRISLGRKPGGLGR